MRQSEDERNKKARPISQTTAIVPATPRLAPQKCLWQVADAWAEPRPPGLDEQGCPFSSVVALSWLRFNRIAKPSAPPTRCLPHHGVVFCRHCNAHVRAVSAPAGGSRFSAQVFRADKKPHFALNDAQPQAPPATARSLAHRLGNRLVAHSHGVSRFVRFKLKGSRRCSYRLPAVARFCRPAISISGGTNSLPDEDEASSSLCSDILAVGIKSCA